MTRTTEGGPARTPNRVADDATADDGWFDLAKWAYGTVTVIAAVSVYRWTGGESPVGAYAIVLGPALAVAAAHLYAEAIEAYVGQDGRFERGQVLRLVRGQGAFLLLTVPALVLLGVYGVLGREPREALDLVHWVLLTLLGSLAVRAARRGGLTGWRVWVVGAWCLVAALAVVVLTGVLKPH